MPDDLEHVRFDKWLKTARFFKHRSDAVSAIDGGLAKINGERVKPAKIIKIGDILTIKISTRYRDFIIKGMTNRSLPAKLAVGLYEPKDLEGITPEMSEMIAILDVQDKQNRKEWKKFRENKKKRREVSRSKYLEF